jgi:hypothetical protein
LLIEAMTENYWFGKIKRWGTLYSQGFQGPPSNDSRGDIPLNLIFGEKLFSGFENYNNFN